MVSMSESVAWGGVFARQCNAAGWRSRRVQRARDRLDSIA